MNSIEQFTNIYSNLFEEIENMSTISKFELLNKSIKAFFFDMRMLANSDRRKDHLQLIDFFKNSKDKNSYNINSSNQNKQD